VDKIIEYVAKTMCTKGKSIMHADTDEADVDDDGDVVFGSGLVLLALCVVSCLPCCCPS
jgi:hypothetical protein